MKLSDHMSKRFVVIVKNVVMSFKHEYRRPHLTSRCDITNDVISMENSFSGTICNDFFISDVKIYLPNIFQSFRNGRHFEVLAAYWTGNCTCNWVFDLFFLPCDLVILPLTNNICRPMWRTRLHMWTKFSDDWLQTATCIAENVTIYSKYEYRRPSLTSHFDVVSDVINIKILFLG